MSFFSRFYDFEKFLGIPREKFPNSQFFPFPWEKNLGGKTETLVGMDGISYLGSIVDAKHKVSVGHCHVDFLPFCIVEFPTPANA